jgi:predicted RNA binding protein YcfA (HicA-like mRNA interferase family)
MSKLPQVSHERIVRALKRAGFYVLREGKHISMTDAKHLVIIPRHHTIKPGHSDTYSTPQTSPLNSSGICFSSNNSVSYCSSSSVPVLPHL